MVERREIPEQNVLLSQYYELTDEMRDEVLSYAVGLTGDQSLSEDLYMDSWWEILDRFPSITRKEPIPLSVYFKRVIHSRFMASLRQSSATKSFDEYEENTFEGDSDITDIDLKIALELLNSAAQKAISLLAEGYDAEEVIEILGITIDEFNSHIASARDLLSPFVEGNEEVITKEERTEILDQTILHRQTRYQNRALASLLSLGNAETELISPNLELECTLEDISIMLGRSRLWVVNHLYRNAIAPVFKKEKMGRRAAYFPKTAIILLQEESDKYKVSGGRLTIPMLAAAVGKDREWIIRILEEQQIEGELYEFEESGRVDVSYSSDILELLQRRANEIQPAEENWYTENGLMEKIEKSHNWIKRRLKQINIKAEPRLDAQGVSRMHYPPSVCDILIEMKLKQDLKRIQKKWYE